MSVTAALHMPKDMVVIVPSQRHGCQGIPQSLEGIIKVFMNVTVITVTFFKTSADWTDLWQCSSLKKN